MSELKESQHDEIVEEEELKTGVGQNLDDDDPIKIDKG